MIKIKIICVGKIKDNYLNQGISEYLKRLSGYCSLEIIELKDEKIGNDEDKIKEIESNKIMEKISDRDYVILLDLKGKELTSEQLADKLDTLINTGVGNYCFIIGGSLGVNDTLRNKADFLLSFSKLTFTHQMIRLFLLEQIYRSFKIINNETYHK